MSTKLPHPQPSREIFSSWEGARVKDFQTHGRWMDMGYTVKTDEDSHASVRFDGQLFQVFHREQVRELTEPKKSRRILLGRFLGWCDWYGFRRQADGEISQHPAKSLHGSAKDLIYRSFLYRNRTSGIRVPVAWTPKDKAEFIADAFYVRATNMTRYLVLDLDNHFPTIASTEAHLLLLEKLVGLMPQLLLRMGGAKVFYDYSQFAPRGIHIWIVLPYARNTQRLHARVRKFLVANSDPGLDERLRMNGLVEMGSIEILPTESHLIRFFGTYDRCVFTTKELKPRDNAFDADGLLAHITARTTVGNPCRRYGELARVGADTETTVSEVSTVTLSPKIVCLTRECPTAKDNPFAHLVDACLNGVTEADVLFEAYLRPLATALYLRDLHDHPQRGQEVVKTLMRWLELKHNGLVTRILDKKTKSLKGIITRIVKNIGHAPAKVQGFWASVRQRDLAHPDHRISLVRCMETVVDKPFPVTKANLPEVRKLIGCEAISSPVSAAVEVFLPCTVEARLRHHLLVAGRAPGARTERIIGFADRLIKAFGLSGHKRIHWTRINALAGLGKGRKSAGRYKKHLIGAGILEPGPDKSARPGQLSSEYLLTDWVVEEILRACLPTEPQESPSGLCHRLLQEDRGGIWTAEMVHPLEPHQTSPK